MSYALIADIVIAVLLVITISYAISLNKRMGMIRRDRGELEKLAQKFTLSTEKANESLGRLQSTAEILQHQIDTAHALHSDLAFLLERGEKAADRLEDAIRQSRDSNSGMSVRATPDEPVAPVAPVVQGQKTVAVPQKDQNSQGSINGDAGNTSGNTSGTRGKYSSSDAERDLLKAIRSSS